MKAKGRRKDEKKAVEVEDTDAKAFESSLDKTCQIIAGPSKWDLMLALFEPIDSGTKSMRNVSFTIKHPDSTNNWKLEVWVTCIKIFNAVSEEFLIAGVLKKDRSLPFYASFNLTTRKGEFRRVTSSTPSMFQ